MWCIFRGVPALITARGCFLVREEIQQASDAKVRKRRGKLLFDRYYVVKQKEVAHLGQPLYKDYESKFLRNRTGMLKL